jgi:hypothetical protein
MFFFELLEWKLFTIHPEVEVPAIKSFAWDGTVKEIFQDLGGSDVDCDIKKFHKDLRGREIGTSPGAVEIKYANSWVGSFNMCN